MIVYLPISWMLVYDGYLMVGRDPFSASRIGMQQAHLYIAAAEGRILRLQRPQLC